MYLVFLLFIYSSKDCGSPRQILERWWCYVRSVNTFPIVLLIKLTKKKTHSWMSVVSYSSLWLLKRQTELCRAHHCIHTCLAPSSKAWVNSTGKAICLLVISLSYTQFCLVSVKGHGQSDIPTDYYEYNCFPLEAWDNLRFLCSAWQLS